VQELLHRGKVTKAGHRLGPEVSSATSRAGV
jgi:hypothetical protein